MTTQLTASTEEIVHESDDLIEFGEYDGVDFGTYRIQVHRNEEDDDGNREIYSGVESFDDDGNVDGNWYQNFPDHITIAKQRWDAIPTPQHRLDPHMHTDEV